MRNQPLNTYPYSSDDGEPEKQCQAAEKQRQQAKIQRNLVTQQHLELVINWAAAEQQRLIDEELRVSAEAERQESEKQRRVSEQLRISAEESRQATEQARMVAEMLRQAAEDARQATHEQQLVLKEMRHAAQEFDHIHLELRPSNR